MYTAQIRANFAQNRPSKRLLTKMRRKSHLTILGENPLRRSRARFPLLSPAVTSSPGAGEVFPLRGSQAVTFVAKVLDTMKNLATT